MKTIVTVSLGLIVLLFSDQGAEAGSYPKKKKERTVICDCYLYATIYKEFNKVSDRVKARFQSALLNMDTHKVYTNKGKTVNEAILKAYDRCEIQSVENTDQLNHQGIPAIAFITSFRCFHESRAGFNRGKRIFNLCLDELLCSVNGVFGDIGF